MSLDVDDQKAAAGRRRSRRWPWIAVAAGIVVVAVVLAVVISGRGGDKTQNDRAGVHPGVAPFPVLQVPAVSGRCMVPSAALLAQRPIAFEGRVSDLTAKLATITVVHRYAGEIGDTMVAQRPPPTTEAGLRFVKGGTYLLAATKDGTVAVCGFSGVKTPALAKMYAAAFGG